jgi:AbrB family looped-hinge helix DNA binding protein
MPEATISAKNQIVIPREARKALHLRAGDKVLVSVCGDRVIVLQKPAKFRAAIRGMGAGADRGQPTVCCPSRRSL